MTRVAVVVLDTLRKDAFDRHFEWLDGKRFENAWSTSHWTVPAHASLFTGKYASETGCYARSPHLESGNRTLAGRLSASGFRTRAFSANRHVSPYFGFDRGFDEFRCVGLARADDDRIPSRSEYFQGPTRRRPAQVAELLGGFLLGDLHLGSTVRRAVDKLYSHRPQFPFGKPDASRAISYVRETEFEDDEFLFLNLMDAHAPYKPPLRYQSFRYSADDVHADWLATFEGEPANGSRMESAYEDCVRYLSDAVGEVLEELSAFDYVIVLSDHGESFGENGVWAHPIGLHPELTHVPLVVRGPDVDSETVEAPVNLLDVFATVADASGLDVETSGQSLLGDVDPRPCLTEYHGIAYERKLEKLREVGLSEREVAAYDEPRFGVALSPDYYGYESVDGFTEGGSSDRDSPGDVLAESKSERPDLGRDGVTLDDDVESQLDQLGYL
ncbi:arylsulfatase [Halobacteriales archaeon QS_1_68_20]|nr:MAG: arylsulfatase [Halobacteriales archaeon QS_1_68_20]